MARVEARGYFIVPRPAVPQTSLFVQTLRDVAFRAVCFVASLAKETTLRFTTLRASHPGMPRSGPVERFNGLLKSHP